jgi:Phosphodiester glycosidase
VSSTLFTRAVGIGLVGLVAFSATTAWASPITTKRVISRKTLKPGVVLVHSRITVRGVFGAQEVYKLMWKLGNRHVRLHSSLLGPYDDTSTWITDHGISHLASAGGPPGMIAAMTGDYSIYKSWSPTRSVTSGLLVQDRRIFRMGTGSLAVGYKPNGRFIMGHPSARPMKLALGGGVVATVGAFNPAPWTLDSVIRSDQVAVYTHPGARVAIPSGAIGVVVNSDVLATQLRGNASYTNTKGGNRRETVVSFRFTEPDAARQPVSMPIAASACGAPVCQPSEVVTIPARGVLLLARTDTPSPVVAPALTALASSPSAEIDTAIDDIGWSNVSDVTGGKPMLVDSGRAITSRPASIDPWQWDCGGGCWRPALVQSGGSAWMILIGGKGGGGLTMPRFASVLAAMGATNAMGFDNNNSAELWRPGHQPITGYGYERMLPTATSLAYRG